MKPDFGHSWIDHGQAMIMTMRADDAKRWDAAALVVRPNQLLV